jgi:hypothetical protein
MKFCHLGAVSVQMAVGLGVGYEWQRNAFISGNISVQQECFLLALRLVSSTITTLLLSRYPFLSSPRRKLLP